MLEDGERWEPPVPGAAPRGVPGERGGWPRGISTAIGPAVHRLLIAAVLGIALIMPSPETWLAAVGPLIVLSLAVVQRVAERLPQELRAFWRADSIAFGLLLPLLTLNAFAGARDDALLSDERAAYIETMVIILIVTGAMFAWVAVARPLPAGDRGILLLPAALQFLAVAAVATDLQPASLSRSLGVAWLVAAVATLLAAGATGRAQRMIPLVAYGAALGGYLITSPRLVTLGGQAAPIAAMHPLVLVAVTVALGWCTLAGPAHGPRRRVPRTERRRTRSAARRRLPDDGDDV